MTLGVNYRTSLGPKHRKLYIFEKLRVLGIQLNEKKFKIFNTVTSRGDKRRWVKNAQKSSPKWSIFRGLSSI